MIHLRRFNENKTEDLITELNELWVDDTHEWKFKKVMLTDLAEELKDHDKDGGNFWLAKIRFLDLLQDIHMVRRKTHPQNRYDISFVDDNGNIWMVYDSKADVIITIWEGIWHILRKEFELASGSIRTLITRTVEEYFKISAHIATFDHTLY